MQKAKELKHNKIKCYYCTVSNSKYMQNNATHIWDIVMSNMYEYVWMCVSTKDKLADT